MKKLRKLTIVILFLVSLSLGAEHSFAAVPQSSNLTHFNSSVNLNKLTEITQDSNPSNGISLGGFDRYTQKAVASFQKDNHLPVTGIVDQTTLNKLDLASSIHTPSLKKGKKGIEVTILQERLVDLGYLKGNFHSTVVKPTVSTTNSPESLSKNSPVTNENNKSSRSTQTIQLKVKATAYTSKCAGCSGITKTGVNLNKHPNKKVIAVDPSVIPLGATVYIPGYGMAKAADTGGAINGRHIDVYVKSNKKAKKWGVKHLTITIVKK